MPQASIEIELLESRQRVFPRATRELLKNCQEIGQIFFPLPLNFEWLLARTRLGYN